MASHKNRLVAASLRMATVSLKISRFSRKIIIAEYGYAEPVVPGRADWLSDQLRIDRSDTRFPEWKREEWTLLSEERHERGERYDRPFAFRNYIRTKE